MLSKTGRPSFYTAYRKTPSVSDSELILPFGNVVTTQMQYTFVDKMSKMVNLITTLYQQVT